MKQTAIAEFVRQLLRSRNLTYQQLCEMLSYRSMTSLTRILQGTANRSSLISFSERIRECSRLLLTKQESNRVDDLIELHDIGNDDFGTMIALRRILRGEPAFLPSQQLMLYDEHGRTKTLLTHYGAVHLKRVFILNCEYVPLYQEVSLLMKQMEFSVEHWIFGGNAPMHTVRSLHAAIPMLYEPKYTSYCYTLSDDPSQTRGLITSDLMCCEYLDENQTLQRDLIVFTSANVGQVHRTSMSFDQLFRFLPDRSEMQLNREMISSEDMLSYIHFCADLERGRAVYRIKPDLGIEQIPTALLRQAVSKDASPQVQRFLPSLTEVFEQRQNDILRKTAPQYHVMKRRAMWRFVQTGRTSDHLWCCRPYTMSERLEILRFLRDQLMQMPSFHLHFLKDDDVIRDDEIVLYEGRGLSIIMPGTNYHDQNSHAEVLITHSEFLNVFHRFFMESTLRYRVESEEDSALEIDRMIAYCEQ